MTKLEEAAKALYMRHWKEGSPEWENASKAVREWTINQTRAAVEALREPSEAMLSIGAHEVWEFSPDYATIGPSGPDDKESAEHIADKVWKAGVDAILKEAEETKL